MKRLLYYLPLHFVVLIIIGIIFQFYTQFWAFGFLNICIILIFLIVLFLCFRNRILTTIISLLLFFFVGVFSVYLNDDRNDDTYYNNYLALNSSVVFKVKKVLKSGFYYDKYEVEVTQVNARKSIGKVLLNIKKDSLLSNLKVDDRINAKPLFKELIPPLNPHQFDYKFYLFKQGIHHQVFLENKHFIKIKMANPSLLGLSAKFRNLIQESLKNYQFKTDELAVINALLLGQRQDISRELITDYQRAGAIHILAVSGLHVGIILLILTQFFKPVERIKNGKILKTILIVLLLWMFAFIAGLSASVVRAVTMFTFLAVGQTFQRKNVVEFSLIASMFFLLIVKPMFLFDVGFQLSYLAVFGIIWVQPKLYELWKPKLKIIDKFWQLFTVSIAAQVGILPLSIYYFHQFPGLFIASNLVIIPFLGIILIAGILVITLALLHLLPQFLATIYGTIISLMNSFVSWISLQEEFLLKDISISFLLMISWYIFILLGVLFLMNRKSKRLLYFLLSVLLVQCVFVIEKQSNTNKKELIVFHKSRHAILGKRVGEKLLMQHNLDTFNVLNDNSLKSYRIAERIEEIQQSNFNRFLKFSNQTVLIIDSLGIYKLKGLNKPIVVLQYSPKINMKRVIKTLNPIQIIADGSNYKSDVLKWEFTCKVQNVPFHYTGQNGAFILEK